MKSHPRLSDFSADFFGAARLLALGGAWLWCAGCSPDAPLESKPTPAPVEAEAASSKLPAKSPPQQAPRQETPRNLDVDVELRGPARVISGHPQVLPEWADDLRMRIDPEHDDSWSEKLAVRFEVVCADVLRNLLAGDAAAARAGTSEDFEGLRGLFPEFGDARFDDGSFAVHDQADLDAVPESLDALVERLSSGAWKQIGEREVKATVVAISPAEDGLWSCALELRFVGEQDGVPAMLDLDAHAVLREPSEPDGSPQLVSLGADTNRLIRRAQPTFQSISGRVLKDLPYLDREFALGCGDYDRLSDRRGIPFGTGMLGMALGDVNGDGLEDLYISMIGGFPNRLLLHQPDGSVIDGAAAAGVDVLDTTRGALLVDLDNDDDLDLCVARQADLVLYWNDGTGKFSAPQLLDGPGTSPIYSICAADADVDGDLDVFCSRYRTGAGDEHVPTPYHNAVNGAENLYWRNDGERKFTSAGEETGLTSGPPRYSFIGLWEDFDNDGKIDLYVVNDFGPNNLYINTDDGFVDRAEEMGVLDASTGMGISAADVEMDGDLDIYVTNMFSAPGLRATGEANYRGGDEAMRPLHRTLADGMSLLLQDTPGKYVERGAAAGVEHGGWAWGALFYDWNLDGYPEIYVPNGFVSTEHETDVETLFWRWIVATTPAEPESDEIYNRNWAAMSAFNRMEGFSYNGFERNHVYLALGDGTYADVSPISDVDFIDDGRVAARVDWDNDGLEDLVLVNRTAPRLRIVRNTHPNAGHRVAIELHGKHGSADAVSARIRVERGDGKVVTQSVYCGEGLLGQCSRRRFFGLGTNDGTLAVEVTWPDGETQRFEDLAPDRGWKLYREGGRSVEWAFEASPFAGQAPAPLERNPAGVTRAVLSDKMPLRYLSLQEASGRGRRLEDLPATPRLLTFWDPASRAGLAFLRQLAESHSEILATGAVICPVALEVDETSEDAAGIALLEPLGLTEYALSATKTDELVIEALLVEILSTYDDIELPLTFLIDAESNLCALYYGAPRTEDVLDDLRRTAKMPPGDRTTIALSDGYWLAHPLRRYGQIVRALMMLGARDLATDLKQSKN